MVLLGWLALRVVPAGTPDALRAWIVAYPAFLIASAMVAPAIVRYLIFAFPLGVVLAPLLRRRVLGPVLVVLLLSLSLLGGAWWIRTFVASTGGLLYP